MWTKYKMNVSIASQTPKVSAETAIDFLCDKINHPDFEGSEATTVKY